MSLTNIIALLITLAAIFSYVNHRFIKLPTTIGLMLITLLMSLGFILSGAFGLRLKAEAEQIIAQIDFSRTLMHGMLSFLLFAGALHVNLEDLLQQKWVIGICATVGVLCSTFLVGTRRCWRSRCGALAAYYGGIVDILCMRLTDTFMAFPSLVLAIALMAVFQQPGLFNVILVLSVLGWTPIARLVRGSVLATKEQDFVHAIRAMDAGHGRVLFRHILPNCFAPLIVTATIGIASNVVSEAGLSFLGFGTQPPTVSWGTMLAQGRNYLTVKPWVCIFPGLALMLTYTHPD